MSTSSIVVVAVGFLTTACGIAFPTLRRSLLMIGAIQLFLGAFLVLQDIGSASRYMALAVMGVVVCAAFATAGRSSLRRLRPELSLAAAVFIGILASTVWSSAPLEAQRALVIAVGFLTAAFIAVTLLRFGRLIFLFRKGAK